MKMLIVPSVALATAMVCVWALVAPVAGGDDAAKSFDFVGVKKCKMCHRSKKKGNQYGHWLESRHAHAYETLATDKAKKAAQERDIADPQKAPECLKCHITAFPVLDTIDDQKITLEEGISCESCHGAASGYWKKSTMTALRAGKKEMADVGMVKPDSTTCKRCHNEESPYYKEFDYDTFYPKIAHMYPEGL